LSVYNSFSGVTLWTSVTRSSSPAHRTCRIGLIISVPQGYTQIYAYT